MLFLAVALTLMIVMAGIFVRGFLRLEQVPVVLTGAAILGLFAAGQTLVILTGGIDLSAASVAAVAGFVSAAFVDEPVVAIAAPLVLGGVIGVLNGAGIALLRIHPLILTLGTGAILKGLLLLYTTNVVYHSDPPLLILGLTTTRLFGFLPAGAVVWGVASAGVLLLLSRTGFGRLLFAIGDNSRASRMAGVRVGTVQIVTYGLAGSLAAAGGLLLQGFTGSATLDISDQYLLPAIAAVVVGGTSILGGVGSYSGTILGTLLLAVLDVVLIVLDIPKAARQVLYGTVILALAWLYGRARGAA